MYSCTCIHVAHRHLTLKIYNFYYKIIPYSIITVNYSTGENFIIKRNIVNVRLAPVK